MERSPTPWTGRTRPPARAAAGALAMLCCLVAGGCTSSPEVTAPTSTTAPGVPSDSATTPGNPVSSTSASAAPGPDTLAIAITISGGQVTPNGKKIDVAVGQQVELTVTSDEADEIHAHTGGDGYELEVPAHQATTGSFTLDSAGSFEVESHELGKTIVILNAR